MKLAEKIKLAKQKLLTIEKVAVMQERNNQFWLQIGNLKTDYRLLS